MTFSAKKRIVVTVYPHNNDIYESRKFDTLEEAIGWINDQVVEESLENVAVPERGEVSWRITLDGQLHGKGICVGSLLE